jgi:hypothetical protein
MSPVFDLASRCPRLARAHRERRAELVIEREDRRAARRRHTSAEYAVAHRELQLVTAQRTNDAAYIKRRMDLLTKARARLDRATRNMERVGA